MGERDNKKEKKVFDLDWPNTSEGEADRLSGRIVNSVRKEYGGDGAQDTDFSNMKSLSSGGKFIIIFLLICVLVVSVVLFFHATSSRLSVSVSTKAQQISEGIGDKFSDLSKTIGMLFGGAGDSIVGLGTLATEVSSLAEEANYLEAHAIPLLIGRKGSEIISRLESISTHLKKIQESEDSVNFAADKLVSLASSSPDNYLALKLNLVNAQKTIDSLLGWLKSGSPRHILIMFQNPSEIRPAGGFFGSYADVMIENGNIESIDIRDVTDSDKQLQLKTVPPKPLQALVKNWRAADANWFFDFPESASTVIRFLESSALYADQKIFFDGAVAISPKVIEDVLKLIGPLTVGEKTFTSENFLIEIQKSVQAGQAAQINPGGAEGGATYPKGILKDLGAAILEKLASLDGPQSSVVPDIVASWIIDKDLMAYFKDSDLENFAGQYGLSGGVYELPGNFLGDYFAVVEANIAGGKSDLFVKRSVTFDSQINLDGTVNNRVVLMLDHQGNKSQYWWYKIPSQDYIQLFVPSSGRLTAFTGGVDKKIVAPIDYAKSGYSQNQSIVDIESGTEPVFSYPLASAHKELGKKVFSTWSKLKPGEKGQIVFGYTHRLFLPPADGQTYTFVFEKQAGISRNYALNISAPPGFVFAENDLPVFSYTSDDPPGRLTLDLTFKKFESKQE